MTRFVSILLGFLYVAVLLRPVTPVISYQINRSYIASELCVNQDKPELQCNGKCHLKKQLAAVNEEDQDTQKPVLRSLEEYPVYLDADLLQLPPFSEFRSPGISHVRALYSDEKVCKIFHPPQLPGLLQFMA